MSCGKAKAEEDRQDYEALCMEMGEEPRVEGLYSYDYEHADRLLARKLGKENLWEQYKIYAKNCKQLGILAHPRGSEFTSNVRRDDFGFDANRAKLVAKLAISEIEVKKLSLDLLEKLDSM